MAGRPRTSSTYETINARSGLGPYIRPTAATAPASRDTTVPPAVNSRVRTAPRSMSWVYKPSPLIAVDPMSQPVPWVAAGSSCRPPYRGNRTGSAWRFHVRGRVPENPVEKDPHALGARPAQDVASRAHLGDAAIGHHKDRVSHVSGEHHLVGDENHRHALLG